MTQMRFLKGKWEFGKFKLQYRHWISFAQGGGEWSEWADVPTVEAEKEAACPPQP